MRPDKVEKEQKRRETQLDEPRRKYRKPAVEEEDVFTFYTLKCKYPWTGCDNDPARYS